jgi:hypothetical protein
MRRERFHISKLHRCGKFLESAGLLSHRPCLLERSQDRRDEMRECIDLDEVHPRLLRRFPAPALMRSTRLRPPEVRVGSTLKLRGFSPRRSMSSMVV